MQILSVEDIEKCINYDTNVEIGKNMIEAYKHRQESGLPEFYEWIEYQKTRQKYPEHKRKRLKLLGRAMKLLGKVEHTNICCPRCGSKYAAELYYCFAYDDLPEPPYPADLDDSPLHVSGGYILRGHDAFYDYMCIQCGYEWGLEKYKEHINEWIEITNLRI